MNVHEFVQAYPDTMREKAIHPGDYSQYITEAQNWSYKWGRALYDVLSGGNPHSDLPEGFNAEEYTDWVRQDLPKIYTGLQSAPADIQARCTSELNFHHLHYSMLGMWLPLSDTPWESADMRRMDINSAQLGLATRGLNLYDQRDRFIRNAGGTHALFDSTTPYGEPRHMTPVVQAVTGVMQEYDSGIILTEAVRKYPDLTVVPAPLQFERARRKVNVDFLVIDYVGARAVGVQVKSRVRQEDVDAADSDRVVFMDGDADLRNVRVMRHTRERSKEVVAAWPGIIAAKKLTELKLHGPAVRQMTRNKAVRHGATQGSTYVNVQMRARNLLGNLDVDYREVAEIIGERIMAKL